MNNRLFIDWETFSRYDLIKGGLWNYVQHPSTGVYMLGFAFDDDDYDIIYATQEKPGVFVFLMSTTLYHIFEYVQAGKPVIAHNAHFELGVWNHNLHPRQGWPTLSPEQCTCTMARAYAMALPGSLEMAGAALGLPIKKDDIGHKLMLRMSKPDNKGLFVFEKEKFTFMREKITFDQALHRLGQYCGADVLTERELYKRTAALSNYEKKVWLHDYKVNNRGVLFDHQAVQGALDIIETTKKKLDDEMAEVTGGEVTTCSAIIPLKKFVGINGSLAKGNLSALLDEGVDLNQEEPAFLIDLNDDQRRALELRREAGRATSTAKLEKISLTADPKDHRCRNLKQYHGAATGRYAGRGVQTDNLTRDLPPPEVVEEIMEFIRAGDGESIELLYGPALTQISKLLRGFVVAGPGRQLIGGDWSNVEGRGLAWLAGEDWKLQAFIDFDNGKGPDIYIKTYAETFNVSLEEAEPHRQDGKTNDLAFGYGGSYGAMKQFGFEGTKLQGLIRRNAWRSAHVRTTQFWWGLNKAAINAVREPGKVFKAGHPSRQIKYKKSGSFLLCRLPSGRRLFYPYPKLQTKWIEYVVAEEQPNGRIELKKKQRKITELSYKTVPSDKEWKEGRIVKDPTNVRKWARVSTSGGKLAENVTQAICRDLLVDAMLRLEAAGYPVVMHIHDETIEEGHFTEADRQKIQEIMCTPPPWAKGFPLAAECWLDTRYKKA